MIYGIGCDLCQAARVEQKLTGPHGAHFAARVYGPAEPGRADLRLRGKQKGKTFGYDDP